MKNIIINMKVKTLIFYIIGAFALKFFIQYAAYDVLVSFFQIFYTNTSDAYALLSSMDIIHNILVTIEISTLLAIVWIFAILIKGRKSSIQNHADIVESEIPKTVTHHVQAPKTPTLLFKYKYAFYTLLILVIGFSVSVSINLFSDSEMTQEPYLVSTDEGDFNIIDKYETKTIEISQNGEVYNQGSIEFSELSFVNLGQKITDGFGFSDRYPNTTSGKFIKAVFMVTNDSASSENFKASEFTLLDHEGREFTSGLTFNCEMEAVASSNASDWVRRNRLRLLDESINLKSYIPCKFDVLFEVAPDSRPTSLVITRKVKSALNGTETSDVCFGINCEN